MRNAVERCLPLILVGLTCGCDHARPATYVDKAAPPSPAARYTPPPGQEPVAAKEAPQQDAAEKLRALGIGPTVTLGQALELALKNNPVTRLSWLGIRSAAADVGEKLAAWYPTVEVDANLTRQKQAALGGRSIFIQTTWGPTASLNWLLADFGGRSADVASARALLVAAGYSHDAAINDLVLAVSQAYFQYEGAKALFAATEASLKQFETNDEAARERHKAGVATIADVLQAKTALSQQRLQRDTIAGQILTIRGALATALGVPASIPVETPELPESIDVEALTKNVDDLLDLATKERPDLLAARARALSAREKIRSSRAATLPTLGVSGTLSRVFYESADRTLPHADTYTGAVLFRWPVFTGFEKQYEVRKAEEDAAIAEAEVDDLAQRVAYQVWSSYTDVKTAAQRLSTAKDLVASAKEAADVARGRYKEGVGNVLDLLVAESNYASARAQDVQARADLLLSLARLAHDTGGMTFPKTEKGAR